jgi:hypothetical protein
MTNGNIPCAQLHDEISNHKLLKSTFALEVYLIKSLICSENYFKVIQKLPSGIQ